MRLLGRALEHFQGDFPVPTNAAVPLGLATNATLERFLRQPWTYCRSIHIHGQRPSACSPIALTDKTSFMPPPFPSPHNWPKTRPALATGQADHALES